MPAVCAAALWQVAQYCFTTVLACSALACSGLATWATTGLTENRLATAASSLILRGIALIPLVSMISRAVERKRRAVAACRIRTVIPSGARNLLFILLLSVLKKRIIAARRMTRPAGNGGERTNAPAPSTSATFHLQRQPFNLFQRLRLDGCINPINRCFSKPALNDSRHTVQSQTALEMPSIH